VQVKQGLEGVVPVCLLHLAMVAIVFTWFFDSIASFLASSSSILSMERELHFSSVMDVVVTLEDNVVVEARVCLVVRDPLLLHHFFLLVQGLSSLI